MVKVLMSFGCAEVKLPLLLLAWLRFATNMPHAPRTETMGVPGPCDVPGRCCSSPVDPRVKQVSVGMGPPVPLVFEGSVWCKCQGKFDWKVELYVVRLQGAID